jgi:hypothetical protein
VGSYIKKTKEVTLRHCIITFCPAKNFGVDDVGTFGFYSFLLEYCPFFPIEIIWNLLYPRQPVNMSSSVGNSQVYEAGDQRNYKQEDIPKPERYEEGQPNSHLANDSSM